jgi:uncharacterized membrane protein YfcA
MPRSKRRKHHHDQPTSNSLVKSEKARSAVRVAIIFFALLGLGIAFFAAGSSVLWLAIGAIAGAFAGYFFGKQIDRSFSKK